MIKFVQEGIDIYKQALKELKKFHQKVGSETIDLYNDKIDVRKWRNHRLRVQSIAEALSLTLEEISEIKIELGIDFKIPPIDINS